MVRALDLGILSLAAAIRERGHRTGLLIGRNAKAMTAAIVARRPNVVALSATTGAHRVVLAIARSLKPCLDAITVLGGPHATFFPEVIASQGIDLVCRGEGDQAFPDLLAAIDRGGDLAKVNGF